MSKYPYKTRSKYNNEKTIYNSRAFDSKKEAAFAQELDLLKFSTNPSDRVKEYQAQVPFPIVINGVKICTYYADFVVTYQDGNSKVYDVKGMRLPVYKIKKKLVEAVHNIIINEV